jgi:hypothetical protein
MCFDLEIIYQADEVPKWKTAEDIDVLTKLCFSAFKRAKCNQHNKIIYDKSGLPPNIKYD